MPDSLHWRRCCISDSAGEYVADGCEQARVFQPVDPFEGGVLDGVQTGSMKRPFGPRWFGCAPVGPTIEIGVAVEHHLAPALR